MSDEELLTVEEVAARLKVHRETVRRWVRAGIMQGLTLGSRKAGLRIRGSEVERFLRQQGSNQST